MAKARSWNSSIELHRSNCTQTMKLLVRSIWTRITRTKKKEPSFLRSTTWKRSAGSSRLTHSSTLAGLMRPSKCYSPEATNLRTTTCSDWRCSTWTLDGFCCPTLWNTLRWLNGSKHPTLTRERSSCSSKTSFKPPNSCKPTMSKRPPKPSCCKLCNIYSYQTKLGATSTLSRNTKKLKMQCADCSRW